MFGPESKLFPRASKLKGAGNSQYPGQQEGDIPNWKEKYVYALDREVMDLNTGLYYRCIQEHTASEVFVDDLTNGYWTLMISAGGSSSIKYSNVCFVDPFIGNNGTASPGRFDLPFLTPEAALLAANALAPTLHSRAMVWIRKGVYTSVQADAYNNVDVYCEPGVVFNSYFTLTDSFVGATNFNWYGFAKWDLGMASVAFKWVNASTILVEGDSFVNSGPISICYNVLVGTSNVTYNFNSIESLQTIGTGFAFSWRNNVNATLNVKKHIRSPHTQHDIRAGHKGNLTINCPNNILTDINVYGGNFKQIIYLSSSSDSVIEINGNLINKMTSYLGGLESMILSTSGSPLITVNGNIITQFGIGVSGRSSEIIVVNGNVTAGIYVANQITGAGEAYFNGGVYQNNTQNPVFLLSATKKLFIRNASIYNNVDVTSGVDVLSNTSKLCMYNCIAGRNGTVGYLVYGGVAGVITQLQNIRSVGALHPNVTDQLVPTGLIVDPLLIVPKY